MSFGSPGQTEVVVLILVLVLAASRTSAGTTELVEESQSALTLLLSTFCCWARHHMKTDSATRMTKINPSPANCEPEMFLTACDSQ